MGYGSYRNRLIPMMALLCAATLQAQPDTYINVFTHTKDSLVNELKKHPEQDTVRANILLNILDGAVYLAERKQVLPYWLEATQLGRKFNNRRIAATCLNWKGSFLKSERKTDSAFIYLDSAILLASTPGDDRMHRIKGSSLFQKGMIFETQENLYSALSAYFESLKSYDSADLIKLKMTALRIATIYVNLHNEDKALEYYQYSLQLFNRMHDKIDSSEADGIYMYIAGIYYTRGDLPKASYYLNTLKPAMPDSEETIVTGGYYRLAGQIALKEHKPDSSLLLMKESLKYYGFTRDMHIDEVANVCTDMAGLYLEKKDLSAAKKYAEQALAAAKESGHKETMSNALGLLAKYYSITGNPAAAYQALNQATALNDSVLAETNVKQAATLAAIYENDKKEKAIAQLEIDKKTQAGTVKQKALLNTIFFITIVALLIISSVLYLNFNNKQKIKQQKIIELEKEKQLLGVEAMLKGQEEERSRVAKDLHDGLGGMLSGVKISFCTIREGLVMDAANAAAFEKSLFRLDTTIAELRKVAHNLMPESLVKFGLKSAVADFCASMQLSCSTTIICEQFGIERELGNVADVNIYRIIQELVNNAVTHGKAGQVLVQLTKTDSKVLITVEDNGKGFLPGAADKNQGIGLANIRSRINYFNGTLDIASKPGEGTTIYIELSA